jgi:hypothetical protein
MIGSRGCFKDREIEDELPRRPGFGCGALSSYPIARSNRIAYSLMQETR